MPHNVFKIGIVVISKINYGRFFGYKNTENFNKAIFNTGF